MTTLGVLCVKTDKLAVLVSFVPLKPFHEKVQWLTKLITILKNLMKEVDVLAEERLLRLRPMWIKNSPPRKSRLHFQAPDRISKVFLYNGLTTGITRSIPFPRHPATVSSALESCLVAKSCNRPVPPSPIFANGKETNALLMAVGKKEGFLAEN
ncbi:hypothetical protein ZIOFF_034619 [Zingiber officinale]|uniref:Uncharacterized protein n=1 Tax=Zingiber officinale TaxID=94328 RepID=A0A8J5L807_ZINOF|nr:hypothetical protein ZIOFF_034619 [Zingiber officinale]